MFGFCSSLRKNSGGSMTIGARVIFGEEEEGRLASLELGRGYSRGWAYIWKFNIVIVAIMKVVVVVAF